MNIILSIKPKWAELIYSGKKKIEWRKNLPCNREILNLTELRDGTDKVKVYLYETAPVKKVTGFFYWGGVGIIDVRKLEEDVNGCVPIEDLKRYNGDRCSLCAWRINRPTRLHTPLTIDEFGFTRPPQSWCYDSTFRGVK